MLTNQRLSSRLKYQFYININEFKGLTISLEGGNQLSHCRHRSVLYSSDVKLTIKYLPLQTRPSLGPFSYIGRRTPQDVELALSVKELAAYV
jgi:hypothetical protein